MPFANRFQLFSSLSCFNLPDSASDYVVNDSINLGMHNSSAKLVKLRFFLLLGFLHFVGDGEFMGSRMGFYYPFAICALNMV